MSDESRRSFLRKALASASMLCLPGLPLFEADSKRCPVLHLTPDGECHEWEQDYRPVSLDDIEQAVRNNLQPFIGQDLTPATAEAIKEALRNTLRSGEIREMFGVNWIVTMTGALHAEGPVHLFGNLELVGVTGEE